MLWIKAFHIVFMVTWFAGLFYLPRLFIYHADAADPLSLDRFVTMERRLFAIMSIGAVLTLVFGLALVALLGGTRAGLWHSGWWWAKLGLVIGLIAYHWWCHALMRELAERRATRSDRWYRWFNEVPALFLIAIVVLVIVRPF